MTRTRGVAACDNRATTSGEGVRLTIPDPSGPYATLPVGRHPATFDEIYEKFVVGAPFSERRELIFEALTLYAKVLATEFSTL